MNNKAELNKIKRKLGAHKKIPIWACAHGYNENDEILFDVLMTPYEGECDLTEAEIHERYPENEFQVTLKVIGVSNGMGGYRLDERGRREIVDMRGL